MSKLKKTFYYIFFSSLILLVIGILSASLIAKHFIEKYAEQYTGRKVTLNRAYINPLTGYIYINDIRIFEDKSDSIFVSAASMSVNISLIELIKGNYEISEITLNRPIGNIIQHNDSLNFQDLITLFSADSTAQATNEKVHVSLLNIKITDGQFVFQDTAVPINYSINQVNLESKGLRWDRDTIAVKFSFLGGNNKGDIKGDITMNTENLNYRFSALVKEFDLEIIGQYLKEFMAYGTFKATLDANINASGNFNDQENIKANGSISINEFHFGANLRDDYASFQKLNVVINNLSPKDHIYDFDTVSLEKPYFKYEKYDYLDNLETMFGKDGSNINNVESNTEHFNLIIEIAKYIKVLAKNFFYSNYKVTRFEINNAELKFNDYSLAEKFAIEISPLSISSDSIDKNRKEVFVALNTEIKPYGAVSMHLKIDPRDSVNFQLNYSLSKLPASLFNPYTIHYTSYPMDRGTLELSGTWNVRDGNIQSMNHLLIIDARTANRLKNKDSKWIPMWLVMAFIRDRGNVIDYEIPITGKLKDPQFHLGDVITDVVTNIFVKPATTKYRLQVKNTETKIEKALNLKWAMRTNSLEKKEEKFIEKMAEFLADNTNASIIILPQYYSIKEKEYILLFEAKKMYYQYANKINSNSFSESDSAQVDKMSVKDSLFTSYLDNQLQDSLLFTVQDKCQRIIDQNKIDQKFKSLNKERKEVFLSYFAENKTVTRVKFSKEENTVPYDGFSVYKIEYNGEFPKSLLEAYREMMELNDKAPRKKFKEERKADKNSLSSY